MNLTPFQHCIRLLGLAGCVFFIGDCSEYLDRRDTLRRSSGEAVQNNVIIQMIDPWPNHAFINPRTTSGERAQRAVERYRNPGSGAGFPQQAQPSLRGGDIPQPRLY